MTKLKRSFSVRTLLLTTAVIAVLVTLAIPLYRRATIPALTDQRSIIRRSNTVVPAISMNVHFSGVNRDQARMLFLYRQTNVANHNWFPDWFEPNQLDDGTLTRGQQNEGFMVNGKRLYPQADSNLTVVYGSDDEDPAVIRVPYSKHSAVLSEAPATIWHEPVDEVD